MKSGSVTRARLLPNAPANALAILVAAGLALFASASALALDINDANRAQLEALRGISVAGADRILIEREKRPFRDWNDLMARVKGIRQGLATRFSDAGVTVNGSPFTPPSPAPPPPEGPASH